MVPRHPPATASHLRPHLFAQWPQLARRLRSADRVALFFDFDGTLVPLRERPTALRLDPEVRLLLRRLARHPRVTLCVISGRRRADLRRALGVSEAICLGLHGWEGRAPASRLRRLRTIVRQVHGLLSHQLAGQEGIWIEDKGAALGIHYRGASPATVRRARQRLLRALVPFQPNLRLLSGKKIWEVLPQEIKDKGAAVREVLQDLPGRTLAWVVGDDTTDEAMFAAVPRGVTVHVGKRQRTHARFYLRNPGEVKELLQRLEAELNRRTA
jgi:trehalose-phosphatase